jgi:uncharacterized membrane protein YfcA
MDFNFLMLLVAVAGASALQSATGIGFGVIAGPVMLIVLNSGTAIQISIALSFLIAAMLVPSLWRRVDRRLLMHFLGGSLVGLPLGLFVFMNIGIDLLKFVAGLAVLFTLIFVLRKGSTRVSDDRPQAGRVERLSIGAISGIMSGSLAMPGPVPAAWMAGQSYDKETVRATILAMFIFSYAGAFALQASVADLRMETLWQCLKLAPPTILGIFFGRLLASWFTEQTFRLMLILVLASTAFSLFLVSIPNLVT